MIDIKKQLNYNFFYLLCQGEISHGIVIFIFHELNEN